MVRDEPVAPTNLGSVYFAFFAVGLRDHAVPGALEFTGYRLVSGHRVHTRTPFSIPVSIDFRASERAHQMLACLRRLGYKTHTQIIHRPHRLLAAGLVPGQEAPADSVVEGRDTHARL